MCNEGKLKMQFHRAFHIRNAMAAVMCERSFGRRLCIGNSLFSTAVREVSQHISVMIYSFSNSLLLDAECGHMHLHNTSLQNPTV